MSDRQRKRRRTMRRRRLPICANDWLEIFELMHHRQLGLEIATLNDTFNFWVDEHFKKRKWTLGNLWIGRGTYRNEAIIVMNYWTKTEEHLRWPDRAMPDNVVGFQRITIHYVDHNVIDFLRRIRRLFQPKNNGDDGGIGLNMDIFSSRVRIWDVFRDSIWLPLVNASVNTKLYFSGTRSFDEFRRHISPTFLRDDLANLRVFDIRFKIRLADGPNGQLLHQWLHTPRADGKPKLLKQYYLGPDAVVEQLKTTFLSAESAVNFVTVMKCGGIQRVPFELYNWRTGERLTFQHYFNYDDCITRCLLERGPIWGRNVEQWAKWVGEAMDMRMEQHNLLTVSLADDSIGHLRRHCKRRNVR